MQFDTITYALTDDIAVLCLNRPAVMNALNALMRAELTEAIGLAGAAARVVVLTGAGRAFCGGQDLADRTAFCDVEATLNDEYVPLLRAIRDCPVPTIAAVQGADRGLSPPENRPARRVDQQSGRATGA